MEVCNIRTVTVANGEHLTPSVINVRADLDSVGVVDLDNVTLQVLAVVVVNSVEVEAYNSACAIVEDEGVRSVGLF